MADPITWGLINLVKKGVNGVQTTLDGVSDKVSGLPDSLDTDFTEVKNAISEVDEKVVVLSSLIDNVQYIISSTNSIVKDILYGTQISEWITDLETGGESSTTYSDSSRMIALVKEPSATQNTNISAIIYKWAYNNSMLPDYFLSCTQNDSIAWSNFSNLDSICKNKDAFSAAVSVSVSADSVFAHQASRKTIFSNYSVTESVLSQSVPLASLKKIKKSKTIFMDSPFAKNIFILQFNKLNMTYNPSFKGIYATPSGQQVETIIDVYAATIINKFSTNTTCSGINSFTISYVDFS